MDLTWNGAEVRLYRPPSIPISMRHSLVHSRNYVDCRRCIRVYKVTDERAVSVTGPWI